MMASKKKLRKEYRQHRRRGASRADKRIFARSAILIGILLVSMGASYRTPNFVVETPDRVMAQEFCSRAESLRAELAQLWLGRTLPQWSQPCSITVNTRILATSTTKFRISNGEVTSWCMNLYGSRRRIMENILPHEINHTIFASHFRQVVPKWCDEGAAISVEPASEGANYHRQLRTFLTSRRGIAFNRMFAMNHYPQDYMPLYAQGLSLTEYLIQQGGRRKFINYLRDGLQGDQWASATKTHYGHQNLGELQGSWVAWVGRGVPATNTAGYG